MKIGWLVSLVILLASIPILYSVSIEFFAPLFNEEINVNLFIQDATIIYIFHIVASILITAYTMKLDERLGFTTFYLGILGSGALLAILSTTGREGYVMTEALFLLSSFGVFTSSVIISHKLDEALENRVLKRGQRSERSEVMRIGKNTFIIGSSTVKKCFKGLSSDVLEDVVNGIANWLLLRDIRGVPKFIRYDADRMCIHVEYVEGANLREFILGKGGRLSEQEASCIALKIARVLKEALNRGIVHRDLKPENVIVSKNGDIWVIDWEYSVKLKAEQKAWVGTIPYAPQDRAVTNKYDVYSLGIILQEMTTGRSDPRATARFQNTELGDLIKKMKEIEPESRASMDEVIEVLNKICESKKAIEA